VARGQTRKNGRCFCAGSSTMRCGRSLRSTARARTSPGTRTWSGARTTTNATTGTLP